jgi:glucose/arabinose dehydrogenase
MDTSSPTPQQKSHTTARSWVFIAIVVVVATAAALLIWWAAMVTMQQTVQLTQAQQPVVPTASTATPQLAAEVVIKGRSHIWDVAFLPSREMLFTERKGTLAIVKDGSAQTLRDIEGVAAKGEGGLMGLAVDPKFTANRFIYTCLNSTQGDVRVVRWRVADNLASVDGRADIVTGIPANASGRHSGCRIVFGPDGYLWVGTGDAALGDTGMQPKSLGGKVLRVDRDGKAAPGNVGGAYDARVFSYGHRNVQGIAFFPQPHEGILGVSVEHGSTVDDEVNLLRPGNFGWAPPAQGYNESSVPMTDKTRFPDAIEATWRSGSPTQAPSGAAFVTGSQWKGWDGYLMVAMLKDKHMKVLAIDAQNKVAAEHKLFEGQFGRLRAAVQGPDGSLYLTTDNSSDNQIIRVTPY